MSFFTLQSIYLSIYLSIAIVYVVFSNQSFFLCLLINTTGPPTSRTYKDAISIFSILIFDILLLCIVATVFSVTTFYLLLLLERLHRLLLYRHSLCRRGCCRAVCCRRPRSPAETYGRTTTTTTMDVCGKKRLLMIMTSSCAGAAFGLLCIAVATDYWLYTSERVVDSSYNTSAIYKRTYSGLWRKCEHTGEYLPASHSSYCCYICLCFYSFYYYYYYDKTTIITLFHTSSYKFK
ncbi:CACNG5 [Acanthosepion pharaonis]|uniref:CACNG5 n=1 Tax=Acanthosepion pharaonis TaxID=158019 RepID=A0A812CA94_ACAPH|nr:CACNG5 [Sepia pharaonis]